MRLTGQKRAPGICSRCGRRPAPPFRKNCDDCNAAANARLKRSRAAKIGMCATCFKNPPRAGRKTCEPCAEYQRQRRDKRPEENRLYLARPGVKDRIRGWRKQHYRKDVRPHLLMMAKARAKDRGLPFELLVSDIAVPSHCPLLGIPIVVAEGHSRPGSPSLDRIDPAQGYVPGNVWVISHRANTIKQDATTAELRTLAHNLERLEWET